MRLELGVQLLDPLRPLARLAANTLDGVLPESLEARDLLAGGVLLALQGLDLDDPGPAPLVERHQLGEQGVGLQAAVLQPGTNLVEVFANEGGIQHGEILY